MTTDRDGKRIATPVEILLARVTYSETGYPASLDDVEAIYGRRVNPAPDTGWFWIGATPLSAARIRRNGHKAVGTLTTTWIPRQEPGWLVPDQDEPEGEWLPMYAGDGRLIGNVPPRIAV